MGCEVRENVGCSAQPCPEPASVLNPVRSAAVCTIVVESFVHLCYCRQKKNGSMLIIFAAHLASPKPACVA